MCPLSKLHPASNGGIGLRAKPLIAVTILTAGLIAAAGGPVDARAPLALMNTTPSEPIRLYCRTTGAPARGPLIAFPPLAVAEGMASQVSERAQAGLNEIEAMYGELIREQRRLAKAH